MIVTEQEAKTKMCCGPWVNIYTEEDGGTQREKCAASRCMAWRWEDAYSEPAECLGYCGLGVTP
jgi:hypothetical protein